MCNFIIKAIGFMLISAIVAFAYIVTTVIAQEAWAGYEISEQVKVCCIINKDHEKEDVYVLPWEIQALKDCQNLMPNRSARDTCAMRYINPDEDLYLPPTRTDV